MTSKRRYTAEDIAHAKETLTRYIEPGAIVYFTQRHSKTGARRYLRVFAVSEASVSIVRVTSYAARACGFRLDTENQEIVIDGGGFSAIHEITDSISCVLFGKGGMLHDEML